MGEALNATHLFLRPGKRVHNSEQWWTAFFGMLVLYLAKHPHDPRIPIKEYRSGARWHYLRTGLLNCAGLSYSDVLMEAKPDQVFGEINWNTKFLKLKPDITILRQQEKRVILIENKTVGTHIGDQLKLYVQLARILGSRPGWTCDVIFLVSLGYQDYQDERDWKALEIAGTKLILWEDVLRIVGRIDCFRELFDVPDLRPYYETPQQAPT
ncbi:MAG: hypothetical protein HY012_07055 [Acidobacteria bacterium]|nr:hypothetical protein [Acidobacteriota bacterium]